MAMRKPDEVQCKTTGNDLADSGTDEPVEW